MSFQYIAIEGPIGVGKTSLAERLATRLDATACSRRRRIRSSPTSTPAGRVRRCRRSSSTCSTVTASSSTLRQGDLFAQSTVSDYLFDKDKIFAYLNLDDNELFIYQRLYDLLVEGRPVTRPRDLPAGADRRPRPPAARARRATSSATRSTPIPATCAS